MTAFRSLEGRFAHVRVEAGGLSLNRFRKILQNLESLLLTFFRVKLGGHDVVLPDS